jgi:hypothetical protein
MMTPKLASHWPWWCGFRAASIQLGEKPMTAKALTLVAANDQNSL